MLKKSQIAIEFVITIGIVLIIFIVLSMSIAYRYKNIKQDNDAVLVKDILYKVKKEIDLANNVEDGYSRTFELPEKAGNIDYSISILNNVLIVTAPNQDYSIKVPPITGSLRKGTNIITKRDGALCINC